MGADKGAAKRSSGWKKERTLGRSIEIRMPDKMLAYMKARYMSEEQMSERIRQIINEARVPIAGKKLVRANYKVSEGKMWFRPYEDEWAAFGMIHGKNKHLVIRGTIEAEMRKLGLAVGE